MAVFISSMHVALKFIEHKMFEMYQLYMQEISQCVCLWSWYHMQIYNSNMKAIALCICHTVEQLSTMLMESITLTIKH